jgi:hypothetical protein
VNSTEAGMLLTYMARVDHRTWGPDDADAFADLLDDVLLGDAMVVAREHLRTDTSWLTPAIIRQRVKVLRGDRVRRLPQPCPNDVEGVDSNDELRAVIRAMADGKITTIAEVWAYERWGGSLHLASQMGEFPALEGPAPVGDPDRVRLAIAPAFGRVPRAQ